MALPTTPTSVDSNEPIFGVPSPSSPTTINRDVSVDDPETSWTYRLADTEVAALAACRAGGLCVPEIDVHHRVDLRCLLAALKQQKLRATLAKDPEYFHPMTLQLLRETITDLGDRLAYNHLVTKRMWDKPHLSFMLARNLGHRIVFSDEVWVLREVELQELRVLIIVQSSHKTLRFEIPWGRTPVWVNMVLWEVGCGFGHLEGQIGLLCSDFCEVTKNEVSRETLQSSFALESFKM